MRTDKERAATLWSAFPPSCSGPAPCPVDLTVTVRVDRTHNRRSTLGDPCSPQAHPPPEECCWWEILIYPSPVRPQIWRCSVNTSWHVRLATDIRNAAVFLCHVDLSQESLWLQRPHRPVNNRSTTERYRSVLMLARQGRTWLWKLSDWKRFTIQNYGDDIIHLWTLWTWKLWIVRVILRCSVTPLCSSRCCVSSSISEAF